MKPAISNGTVKKLLYILAGLGGISLIILIHETGHFLFAKFFNVPTPVFSLGFGPALFTFPLGETVFQIALLPFGGYVEIDSELLAQQTYIPKILIIFGGILFNIMFAYLILFYYALRNKMHPTSALSSQEAMQQCGQIFTQKNDTPTIIGPIGIISMIGKSLAINPQLYWFVLALLSFNMGLLNMIPLPFLDGGKALLFTIEAISGYTIPVTILWFISAAFLAIFMLLMAKITMNDIKNVIGR
jgi:membrane-associated protease RseP (regulator of RpoE activity)